MTLRFPPLRVQSCWQRSGLAATTEGRPKPNMRPCLTDPVEVPAVLMHPADLADERARRAKLRLSALRMILRHAVTNAKPEDIPVLEAVVDAANAGLIGIDDAEDILKTFRRQHAA